MEYPYLCGKFIIFYHDLFIKSSLVDAIWVNEDDSNVIHIDVGGE